MKNMTTYVISIDASRAFDRVTRERLWMTMIEMCIRLRIVLAMKAYYENFYIIVNNERNYAAPFITTIGFKQGGPGSPELYKIYSEHLANEIMKLLAGIIYGEMNIDILMYADDVLLFSTSATEAQRMLDVCTEFSRTHQVKFNPDKTNFMIYSPKDNNKDLVLRLCGNPIVRAESVKYLGSQIQTNYTNKEHVNKRKTLVNASLNNLINAGVINSQMSITTKIKLFNTYIKPLIAYGCELMDLSTTEINELKKTEGNALKRIIGITKKCHSGPVYGAFYMEATDKSILKQQMKFELRLQTNDYLNKFLINSRIIGNNSGMLG